MKKYNRWVLFCLAGVAFLSPLKFGTPVIAQSAILPPTSLMEWIFFPWPLQLATLIVFGALLWLVLDGNRLAAPVDLLFILPLLFLASQAVAAPTSICPQTSADTLTYFAVCVLVFYAAAWYVRDGAEAERVFCWLGLATFLILILALEQHVGGLAETRKYAAMYSRAMPADLRLKLTSERVFGTLVSPNSLAGFLVVAFAPVLAWIWVRARGWDARMKWLTLVFVGGLMIVCLALTGSRGGFMAFAAMVLAGLFSLVLKGARRTRWVVIGLLVVAGVFVLAQRAGLVGLGLESLSARRDYWQGAVAIARDHLWLGTGPGTFGSIYTKYKTATTEEAQLVHNNFLQMWCDSGVVGFVTFALLWLVAVRDAFELVRRRSGDAAAIAICAALAGWTVHGVMDFDLYVPGVAMPAFILLGVLQGLKDVPHAQPVVPRGQTRLAVVTVCAAIVAAVFWIEGRSLMASFAQGRTREFESADPGAAFRAAQDSIDLAPRNPHYHAAAGDLAVRLGRFEEAIQFYRTAIECDPYRASYHWRLARAMMTGGGRADEAVEQLRLAHALNPTKKLYRDDLSAAEESVRQSKPVLLQSLPAKKDE